MKLGTWQAQQGCSKLHTWNSSIVLLDNQQYWTQMRIRKFLQMDISWYPSHSFWKYEIGANGELWMVIISPYSIIWIWQLPRRESSRYWGWGSNWYHASWIPVNISDKRWWLALCYCLWTSVKSQRTHNKTGPFQWFHSHWRGLEWSSAFASL